MYHEQAALAGVLSVSLSEHKNILSYLTGAVDNLANVDTPQQFRPHIRQSLESGIWLLHS